MKIATKPATIYVIDGVKPIEDIVNMLFNIEKDKMIDTLPKLGHPECVSRSKPKIYHKLLQYWHLALYAITPYNYPKTRTIRAFHTISAILFQVY